MIILGEWLAKRTEEDGDCLLWTRAMNSGGVPVATIELKLVNVRRWLLVQQGKRLRPGDKVVPTCRNPRCLSHLKVMSPSEVNEWIVAGGGRRTAAALASSRRNRELSTVVGSMDMARRIRALRAEGLTYKAIGIETGVPWRRCYDICMGKSWVEHAPASSIFTLAASMALASAVGKPAQACRL
jgi:hypothetical protein